MGTKPKLVAVAAAGLLIGLSACGSPATTATTASGGASSVSPPKASSAAKSASPTVTPSAAVPAKAKPAKVKPVVISIKDFTYKVSGPVSPGAKIMMKNADGEVHSITSAKGGFNVNVDGRGGTAVLTAPKKPGTYTFICNFHGNMTGTLVVR